MKRKRTFKSLVREAEDRKARREQRAVDNAALAGEAVIAKKPKHKKSPTLSKLKKLLWDEISLLVRSWSESCLACGGPTQAACHIVPASDGAATRFFLPNLYPGCHKCNDAERHRRGQWVKRHESIFGVEFVDALYDFSKTIFDMDKAWVREQTERIRALRGFGADQVLKGRI